MKVDELKTKADHLWKEAKKDMEKFLTDTSRLIKQGEVQLKDASEKGREKMEKMGYALRKERLYYELGKKTASLPRSQWENNKRINELVREIKKLDRLMAMKKKKK